MSDDAAVFENGGGRTDVALAFVAESRRLLLADYLPKIRRPGRQFSRAHLARARH